MSDNRTVERHTYYVIASFRGADGSLARHFAPLQAFNAAEIVRIMTTSRSDFGEVQTIQVFEDQDTADSGAPPLAEWPEIPLPEEPVDNPTCSGPTCHPSEMW